MFRRQWLLVVMAVVCFSAAARADPVRVCVHDQVNLPDPAEASMRAELKLLFPRLKVVAQSNPCSAEFEDQIIIFVKDTDDGVPTDAPGRAPMVDGKILPALEVFKGPVAQLSGANDLQALCRALGRVAAHELLHYLLQQSGHNVTGLLQERLGAAALRSEDRSNYVSLIAPAAEPSRVFRTASNTPLMNFDDLSPEKRRASSIASSITTAAAESP